MMKNSPISIGQLGKRSGVNIETIRYYEKIALLPPPDRTPAGYRQYDDSHVRRLRFIRRGRDLGFSVEAIRTLLSLAEHPDQPCAGADRLVAGHLADVERKIADLSRLRSELQGLGNCCGHVVAECRIIDSLIAD
jgi:DNA-binding transcriptional MerR regulator